MNGVLSTLALVAPITLLGLAYAALRVWSWRTSQRRVTAPVVTPVIDLDE